MASRVEMLGHKTKVPGVRGDEAPLPEAEEEPVSTRTRARAARIMSPVNCDDDSLGPISHMTVYF